MISAATTARYTALCLTVLTMGGNGRISGLTVFVLPEHFRALGLPMAI